MSKRHGAVGIDAYRDLGYLPEALRNYLLRLGWSHGDDEIISAEQAITWFDLDAVGRAPARFDFAKLDNLNGHYVRIAANERLSNLVAERLEQTLGQPLSEPHRARLLRAMPELKMRPRTLVELAANARFLVAQRPIPLDERSAALLSRNNLVSNFRDLLLEAAQRLEPLDEAAWDPSALSKTRLSNTLRDLARERSANFGRSRVPSSSAPSRPGFGIVEHLGPDFQLGKLPPSEDIDSGTMPVAAATPEPPDDPPEVRSRFQGLRVTVTSPSYLVKVSKVRPNSGVLERPRGTRPA
jgi:glutamyl-tRNA synthetase